MGIKNYLSRALMTATLALAPAFFSPSPTLENKLTASPNDISQTAPLKENLDLPYDAKGENGEEEDAPEIVIFYNQSLEGDGIFYTIDRSGSMKDGELDIAKREVIRNIQEFSDRMQFGIVFFDANVSKFPASGQPADATPPMKSAGISYVQSITAGEGSCVQAGLEQALNMANLSTAKRKVIVYLGDGGGTCNGADEATYLRQTLANTTLKNYQRHEINTIGVLNPLPIGIDFMKKLAANNNGTYTRINR